MDTVFKNLVDLTEIEKKRILIQILGKEGWNDVEIIFF